MRSVAIIAVIAAAALGCDAGAQDICSEYIGQKHVPQSFTVIAAELPTDVRKDEFETTQQFQERLDGARSAGKRVILDRPVLPQTFPTPLEFDADAGLLKVRQSAFQWGTTDWWQVVQGTDAANVASVLDGSNVATVITRKSRDTGSYRAANAYGVSTEVFRSTMNIQSVFDRKASDGDGNMFRVGADDVVGSIPMASAEARQAKGRLRFALVIEPKWPFLLKASGLKFGPQLDDPFHVTGNDQVMFADVLCGLVLDQQTVIASFPTKDQLFPPNTSHGLYTD